MGVVAGRIHVGAVAPYSLRYTVDVPRDPVTRELVFDGTKVTAAAFLVRTGKSSQEREWTANIAQKRTEQLVLDYPFQAGDLPDPVQLHVKPRLDTADGPLYAQVVTIDVYDPDED